MSIYEEIRDEIMTMKIDKKGNGKSTYTKLYKPLLILSMLDYHLDQGDENNALNNPTDVTLLVDNLTIYFENKFIKQETYSSKTNDLSPKKVLRKIREQPLYHITFVKSKIKSKFFFNDLPDTMKKKPRSNKSMARLFEIRVPTSTDFEKMCNTIRNACVERIKKETDIKIGDSITIDLQSKPIEQSTYSRQGQNQYRRKMLEKYNNKCAFCQFDVIHTLVASHAKRWVDCRNVKEKLSEDNGFLLCATHDKMFDQGYLSINIYNNNFIFSEKLNDNEILSCKNTLPDKLQSTINDEMKFYLKYHNNNILK